MVSPSCLSKMNYLPQGLRNEPCGIKALFRLSKRRLPFLLLRPRLPRFPHVQPVPVRHSKIDRHRPLPRVILHEPLGMVCPLAVDAPRQCLFPAVIECTWRLLRAPCTQPAERSGCLHIVLWCCGAISEENVRRVTLLGSVAAMLWLAASAEASAQARGSFAASCTDIEQRGPFLRALCEDRYGRLVPSRIDLRRCPSNRVANANGRLTCEGAGRRSRDRGYYSEEDDFGEDPRPRRRYYDGPY